MRTWELNVRGLSELHRNSIIELYKQGTFKVLNPKRNLIIFTNTSLNENLEKQKMSATLIQH